MEEVNVDLLCMGCMREKETAEGPCPYCGFEERRDGPSHYLPCRSILNGKYLVGKVLGEGGFGITYLGWDLNLDMKVAIKEYYPSGLVTRMSVSSSEVVSYTGEKADFYQTGKNKFMTEAKTLAKFYSLPGIVSVKDFFQESNTSYIVMEYIEGVTLKEYLKKNGGRIPAPKVLEWMRPVIHSLEQVHRTGLIHRDISPDNIMITKDDTVKLLDFGAARDISPDGGRSLSVFLKPGYAPEEQYRTHGAQGPWTDIYALCATIYKCMTGMTPPEPLERMRADGLQSPARLGADLLPYQEYAVLKGLSIDAKDRYQSMEELEAALYDSGSMFRDAEGSRETSDTAKEEVLPPKRTEAEPFPQQPKEPVSNRWPDGEETSTMLPESSGRNSGRKKKILTAAGLGAAVILAVIVFIVSGSRGKTHYYGNTQGNILNMGLAAQIDKESFCRIVTKDTSDNGQITGAFKGELKNYDRLPEKIITDKEALGYNVWDGWLYYLDLDFHLYRSRLDGTRTETLTDSGIGLIYQIMDGKIYYVDLQNEHLCSMDVDGSNVYIMSPAECGLCIGVWDGAVYYTRTDAGSGYVTVYKRNLEDDSEKPVLTVQGDEEFLFFISDGSIFYCKDLGDRDGMRRLLRASAADGSAENIPAIYIENIDGAIGFNIIGDWIYYCDAENDGKLSRIKLDGNKKEVITSDGALPAAILEVSDYVLYMTYDYEWFSVNGKNTDRIPGTEETQPRITETKETQPRITETQEPSHKETAAASRTAAGTLHIMAASQDDDDVKKWGDICDSFKAIYPDVEIEYTLIPQSTFDEMMNVVKASGEKLDVAVSGGKASVADWPENEELAELFVEFLNKNYFGG